MQTVAARFTQVQILSRSLKMKDKTIEKIFKEIGHKSQRLNDLYICILKEDIKEIKKKYS